MGAMGIEGQRKVSVQWCGLRYRHVESWTTVAHLMKISHIEAFSWWLCLESWVRAWYISRLGAFIQINQSLRNAIGLPTQVKHNFGICRPWRISFYINTRPLASLSPRNTDSSLGSTFSASKHEYSRLKPRNAANSFANTRLGLCSRTCYTVER